MLFLYIKKKDKKKEKKVGLGVAAGSNHPLGEGVAARLPPATEQILFFSFFFFFVLDSALYILKWVSIKIRSRCLSSLGFYLILAF
jgi:hypothetical protein